MAPQEESCRGRLRGDTRDLIRAVYLGTVNRSTLVVSNLSIERHGSQSAHSWFTLLFSYAKNGL